MDTNTIEKLKSYKEILDGGIITEDEFNQLKKQLLALPVQYAVVADEWAGSGELPELVYAVDEAKKDTGRDIPDPEGVAGTLDGLEAYSLQLANAVTSEHVTVVKVYADAAGQIDPKPLKRSWMRQRRRST